ncbi:hypothetical protein O0235_06315 [Tepidiforma flava]|uniref:Uncharacterized protein n=1 Tax=Tepidiforma flava TaxID=3004094 RepID=A0ABY7M9D2_9CHLR|nr:hypothetical protein [Tepidiforma flava]WBL37177.1 hypothetical protein O0235_06315 [Tepidiforma flava]
MAVTTATCVLIRCSPEGWTARLIEPGTSPAGLEDWFPLGLDASSRPAEALERARALFPGRLVALYSP